MAVDQNPARGLRSVIPTALSRGDRIGVVSPSDPVSPEDPAFGAGVDFLEGLGFQVVLGRHVHSNTLGYSASPSEKAEDLNRFFRDGSIGAILCSQGGDTANGCLPHLDWMAIRANPKILVGMSDISVLLNAIYTQTGLITFHGNDVKWGYGLQPAAYDVREFLGRLVEGEIGRVEANGERRTIREGVAEGRLLGGNLNCLLKLAGTPYFPDFTGAILFVEGLNPSPAGCDYRFRQLQQMGVFEGVRGVLVGYIDGMDDQPDTVGMEDVLLNVTSEHRFPILKANDFGHNCPNTTLPVGAQVRLDAGRQEIEILEECVRRRTAG